MSYFRFFCFNQRGGVMRSVLNIKREKYLWIISFHLNMTTFCLPQKKYFFHLINISYFCYQKNYDRNDHLVFLGDFQKIFEIFFGMLRTLWVFIWDKDLEIFSNIKFYFFSILCFFFKFICIIKGKHFINI